MPRKYYVPTKYHKYFDNLMWLFIFIIMPVHLTPGHLYLDSQFYKSVHKILVDFNIFQAFIMLTHSGYYIGSFVLLIK